jgi:hypothetical protein
MTHEQMEEELESLISYLNRAIHNLGDPWLLPDAKGDIEIAIEMALTIKESLKCKICKGSKEIMIDGYPYECYYCKEY